MDGGLFLILLMMFSITTIIYLIWKQLSPQKEANKNVPQASLTQTIDQNTEEPCIMEARGVNGQLQLFGNKVRIKREGFLAISTQGLKGDKDIWLHTITSIQLKMPGFTNGYIQFVFSGSKENKGGVFDATQDENTVMFSENQKTAFLAIKNSIESQIMANLRGGQGIKTFSSADELEKLASLKEKGILTEEEFQGMKRKLLQ